MVLSQILWLPLVCGVNNLTAVLVLSILAVAGEIIATFVRLP